MHPIDNTKCWFSGKGYWSNVCDSDWNDWRWQMKNRLTKLEDVKRHLDLSEEELVGFKIAGEKLLVSITPHFFNLINPENINCPIRKQVIPTGSEAAFSPYEFSDPVGEEGSSPVPGIVHRYPDRVLFLVTDRCAAYCRYCTRSRLVSNANGYGFRPNIEECLEYISKHENIRDVLISGGDPLLLSDEKLAVLLSKLADIKHVEFVRIGSRVPVFMPQRITASLLSALNKHPNLWMSIHVNHPKECTIELKNACHKLAKNGIPLGNQSVLLSGVNDDVEIMKSLIHRLMMMKVRPYYLYQCDLVKGSSHLRADVTKGLEIIKKLRGHTTGYAIPQYVIDAPGGGGKIPINPNYLINETRDSYELKNFEGETFFYPKEFSQS